MPLSRINLILALLVAALTAAVVLGPESRRSGERVLLTDETPARIEHVRIQRGNETLEFKRRGTVWRMTAPKAVKADGDKLRAVARILSAPSHRRLPVVGTDLKPLGLEPSKLSLTLDERQLEIGGTVPIGQRRYIRVGDTVHVIDDLFQHHLLAPVEAFVEE